MHCSPEHNRAEHIAESWVALPLEACMTAIIDYRGKTPRKTTFGVPLITAKVIKNGRLLPPDEFISSDDFATWMSRGMPEKGDVVLTTEAPLGEVAQLDHQKVALAQRIVTLRGKPDLLDNTFLKFLFQSNEVQSELRARASGTTVVGIKQSELRKITLTLPPLSEQRRIAKILGDLDDKIELNRKMNETLEQMARALFKSWFIDFDPVRAKMEGRQPTGMDADTAALFPSRLVESELGLIPEGWEVGSLGDVASNPRRGVQPSEINPDTPYIALEHMPRRCIALGDWDNSADVASGKCAFKRGEILFGKLRPYFHKVGVAPLDGICSTDILVVAPIVPEWFGFVLGHISSDALIQFTDLASTGTKMPRTNWGDLSSFTTTLPPKPLAAAFTQQVKPMVERITTNIHQSRTLASLRDTLLPKLMKGEGRLKPPTNTVCPAS
jgi:type I restriction enzyme S subunit